MQQRTVCIRLALIEQRYGGDHLDNAGDDLVECLRRVSDDPRQHAYSFSVDTSDPNRSFHTLDFVVERMDDRTFARLMDQIRTLGILE